VNSWTTLGALYGLSSSERSSRTRELLALVRMEDVSKRRIAASRAACASGWVSPRRSSDHPMCSSWTNLPARSTRLVAKRCST